MPSTGPAADAARAAFREEMDAKGHVVAMLSVGTDDRPSISFSDSNGRVATTLGLGVDGRPSLGLIDPNGHGVTVLGVRVNKASEGQLKMMIGVGAFLMLAMAGLLAFSFLRGAGGGQGNDKGGKWQQDPPNSRLTKPHHRCPQTRALSGRRCGGIRDCLRVGRNPASRRGAPRAT